MNVYEYSRISTQGQNFAQQHNSVEEYISAKGWTITETITDKGVSGGVSYRERNLYKLIQRMKEGDVLIVSEISRLGRSMSDLSKLVNEELKPRKLRLIVVKMGLDLDCSNLKAIDEMILFAFSFSAQIEKELIVERTQSALDVRKQKLAQDGSFVSKKGNTVTSLGRPKGCKASENAIQASVSVRKDKAKANPHNIHFLREMKLWEAKFGTLKTSADVQRFAEELNSHEFKTATGMAFDVPKTWNSIYKARKLYAV